MWTCYHSSFFLTEKCFILQTHASKYPGLSKLSQDYPSTPAAYAVPKRFFSVAGQVYTAEQGGLLPHIVEVTVSSQLWMIEDVPLAVDFTQVEELIDYSKKMVKNKPGELTFPLELIASFLSYTSLNLFLFFF